MPQTDPLSYVRGGTPALRTQGMLGFYADVVRDFLNVPEDLKLLFGISFGTADQTAPVNGIRMGRVPLEQNVVLHDTLE